ncbi:RING finger protein 228 [Paroedura picta]|uniref:RING finger protein 228 n=1 Tax=Paroedura picta TaxID=143630 RepID=UPI004057B70B
MAEQKEQPSYGGSLEAAEQAAEAMAGAEEEPAKEEPEGGEREREREAAAGAAVGPLAESSSWEEHECRICYNRFDLGRRAPKLLECLHTFCQECLAQLHVRAALAAQSGRRGAGEGGGGPGDAAAITCPLCRHRTALPDCRVHSLPLNTKLVDHISLRAAWSALAGSQRQALLLLPVPRPAPAPAPAPTPARPPSERSSQGATPSSSADGSRSALARQCSGGLGGGSGSGCSCSSAGDPSWRRKAVNLGCLCVVFCVLSMLLLFFAWMNWLTGSIFIGVAVLLLFVSTVPFARHGFRNRTGAGAAVALLAPAGANGPGGGAAAAAACNGSPRSRPAADRRTRP